MGVDAILVNWDWTQQRGLPDPALGGTFDAAGDFDRLLPDFDDESFVCWRFIDPYGKTVFNALQMPAFIEELERLLPQAKDGPERNGLLRLKALASLVAMRRHQYLLFLGD